MSGILSYKLRPPTNKTLYAATLNCRHLIPCFEVLLLQPKAQ